MKSNISIYELTGYKPIFVEFRSLEKTEVIPNSVIIVFAYFIRKIICSECNINVNFIIFLKSSVNFRFWLIYIIVSLSKLQSTNVLDVIWKFYLNIWNSRLNIIDGIHQQLDQLFILVIYMGKQLVESFMNPPLSL